MKHNQVLWSMLAFLFYQVINLFRLRPQVLGCCFQCWFSLQSFCSALRACLTRTELCGPSETREGVCPAAHSQRCSAGSLGSGDSVNKESRWGKAGELQNMYSIIPYLWKKQCICTSKCLEKKVWFPLRRDVEYWWGGGVERNFLLYTFELGLLWWLSGKESAASVGDLGLIPGSGRSLEKEMETHSSILAWEIIWTEEPGGLQCMGSQRVECN